MSESDPRGTVPRASAIDKSPRRIAGMFDAIARRYDFLNRFLSAGLDRTWRRKAVAALALSGDQDVLDLCTGTADLALALVARGGARRVVGVDFAAEMLRYGQAKTQSVSARQVFLVRGDAMQIPAGSSSVDAVTIAFGLRNTHDPTQTIREMYRVLRPGGRLAILEFGEPHRQPVRAVYRWYFRRVLPLLGRLISHHDTAYTYLPASVGAFYAPAELSQILVDQGFERVHANALTLGVVYLYTASKSPRATRLTSTTVDVD